MSILKTSTIIISLLYSVLSFSQEVTVTVSEQSPVSLKSLDFKTGLDEVSIKHLKDKGIQVEVESTQTSAQGTQYACVLKSVPKQVYDKLEG